MEAPKFGDDERPVLALRARVQTPSRGGGCNFVLQVLLDGAPLCESLLKPRLLNKPPYFDPPNTTYHFSWFSPVHQGWMTIFSKDFEGNWGGTGRDYEFVFDLSGLVGSGEAATLSFRYLNPTIPAALKLARAPLVVDRLTLGVMKAADVDRLRAEMHKGLEFREPTIKTNLPADAKPGDRAYEVVWTGRKESPPAHVVFGNLDGWTLGAMGDAEVSLAASVDHLLWRRQTAKLSYGAGTRDTVVVLRPPSPILIPGTFDAANLWVYGAIDRTKDRHPRFFALLDDATGREVQLDLGQLHSCYWNLLHGVLDAKLAGRAKFPMKFKALVVEIGKVPAERRIYLESLAFYPQNRKPFAKLDTSKRSIFPTSDDGMLPTPPKGVKVSAKATEGGAELISEAPDGVLRFRVRPADGCLHGVTAQWNDGPWFRPMDGGGVSLDLGEGSRVPAPSVAKLVSSTLKQDRLTAVFGVPPSGGAAPRSEFRLQAAQAVEWTATYSVQGRTLVVDVRCPGGAATGIEFGQLAGLPNPRGIEVPYLMMGTKPGPWIACAGGLFVSVLPDWYHSDFSRADATITLPTADRIGLLKSAVYAPLTNGRRNDLRERVLITVSPEFADTLPNARNPVSPNRDRLAPYMFFMGSASSQKFYATLKRYGIDHVIACDFASVLVDDYAEGFAMRWRPHPLLTAKQVQEFRHGIKSLGYLFGFYIDARDYFPLNEWWDENKVALTSDGDLRDGWYGNFIA
ncbi:MAG: hypothetical protein FJ272_13720, partial [Planctomycetes bacterium]|nr:hypothetical protein [Planctomycetota bacterium]